MRTLKFGTALVVLAGVVCALAANVLPFPSFDLSRALPSATPVHTPTPSATHTPLPTEARATSTHTPTAAPSATPAPSPTRAPTNLPPLPNSVVFVGAGDIASCDSNGDEATAALLDNIAGTVFTLGDNVYELGKAAEFANCYAPSWGRHKARTKPAAGNHDYGIAGATGYYNFFGGAAGDPKKGYYSYDLGAWHVIALNSNCGAVGGCGVGSPQERWLRDDLTRHAASCTLAYWHHPRFSSGPHGSDATYTAFWQALYEANADVVLSGHDHDYERFAPQDPNGAPDPVRGIREFVVGTGGRSLYPIVYATANSEVQNDQTYGVLKLTLQATRYEWQFVPVAGKTFSDAGSAECH